MTGTISDQLQNKILDVPHIKEEWLQESVQNDVVLLSGAFGDLAEFIKQQLCGCQSTDFALEIFADDYLQYND